MADWNMLYVMVRYDEDAELYRVYQEYNMEVRMSIQANGIYVIDKRDLSVHDKIEIAYELIKISAEVKIGLLLGGNALLKANQDLVMSINEAPFIISDDPLDYNAECLLNGDGVKVYVSGFRIDNGESLETRMFKLQAFFEKGLAISTISRFEFNVNIESGDIFEIKVISVHNFKKEMLKLF
jgi:hypothetical protein